MEIKDIEKYVHAFPMQKGKKYLLVVSKESGLSMEKLAHLTLPSNFFIEMLVVSGDPQKQVVIKEK